LTFWAQDVPTGRHWLERWARRTRPDLVLANSRHTQAAVPKLFPGVRSEVVYLPVQPPVHDDRKTTRQAVRAALHTPGDATVILQASRLERWKGHTLLLRALALLRDVPNWICWMTSGVQRPHEATYLAELQALAAELGLADRVQFLGQRSDVLQLMLAADIHCQPNTGPEPFGVAFVEALYAGLPVVSTALGGALEIVDETCGVLVPPDDPTAVARALQRLVQDPESRTLLGQAGPARAQLLCDPATQLELLRNLLNGTVARGLAG
jgi:glycosyltransferase involved in cell wall biosynthesis